MQIRRILIAGVMALAAGCATDSDSTTQKITMDQTPIAVRRGIEKTYPGAKVTEIERETYKDTKVVHYEVEAVTAKGQKVEFKLAEDGTLVKDD
jgi:uncharacterized membrane protein YkoI